MLDYRSFCNFGNLIITQNVIKVCMSVYDVFC